MNENEILENKRRERLRSGDEPPSTDAEKETIKNEINHIRNDLAVCLDEIQRQRESLDRMRNDLIGINETSRSILANQKNAAGGGLDKKVSNYDLVKTLNLATEDIRKNEALLKTVLEKISRELSEEERILKEYSSLEKKFNSINKKYNRMVSSRLGKIMLRAWVVYNKIRGA